MVVAPVGSFKMGSPASEEGRYDDEGPLHGVDIERPFAIGRYEVTRGAYAKFVADSGHSTGKGCWYYDFDENEFVEDENRSWRDPGFSQSDDEPVLCVNWNDAQAYVSWLSRKTGEQYRLLSEAEWEYAVRGGTLSMRYWGDDNNNEDACDFANVGDLTRADAYNLKREKDNIFMCRDGQVYLAPVGSYRPNDFGLHDTLGNVEEWVEDCWHESYAGAPTDGRPWTSGEKCNQRIVRGGTWSATPLVVRAAYRNWGGVDRRDTKTGFRVARTLP